MKLITTTINSSVYKLNLIIILIILNMMKYTAAVALLLATAVTASRKVLPNLSQTKLSQQASTDAHSWYAASFHDAEGNQIQFRVDVGAEAEHFYCSIWGYWAPGGDYHGDYVSCPYYNFQSIQQ